MKKTVFQMRQVSSFRLTRRLLSASIQKTLHVCLAIGGVRHEHKSITITTKTKVLKKIKCISLSCLLMFVEIISLHHLLFVPSSKLHLFEFLALRRLLNRMNYAQSTCKQWQALMCSPQLFMSKMRTLQMNYCSLTSLSIRPAFANCSRLLFYNSRSSNLVPRVLSGNEDACRLGNLT